MAQGPTHKSTGTGMPVDAPADTSNLPQKNSRVVKKGPVKI